MSDGSVPPGQPAPEQRPPGWTPPPGWSPPPPAYPQAPYGQPSPYGVPGPPPPGYPTQYPTRYPPLHQARAIYQPGTIPLKPLGIGAMYSGAIETIRRNPKATLGVAAVVLTAIMLIPTIGVLAWGQVAGFGSDVASGSDAFAPEDVGLLLTAFSGAFLVGLATIVLTGMIVHVVEHAARGQKLSAGAAWKLTRGRVWRLIGLSIVSYLGPVLVVWVPIGLVITAAALADSTAGWITGAVGVLTGLPTMVFLYIRLVPLAPAILVLEGRGVFASMGRAWALTRNQFWRTFGIVLLTAVVAGIASQFLSVPFGIASGIATAVWPDSLVGLLVALLAQNVSMIVSGTLTTPFSAGVVALQYLDQRIRKEGYDIELISRISAPVAPVAPAGPGPTPYGTV